MNLNQLIGISVKMLSHKNFFYSNLFQIKCNHNSVDYLIFKVLIWNYARGICLHLAYYPKKTEHDFLKIIIVLNIQSLSDCKEITTLLRTLNNCLQPQLGKQKKPLTSPHQKPTKPKKVQNKNPFKNPKNSHQNPNKTPLLWCCMSI